MSDAPKSVTLRVASALDQLAEVDEIVERIGRRLGFSEDAVADLGICVTEAVGNAIVHAHGERAELAVDVQFDPLPDGLRVVVRDYGSGFDHDSIPDPTLPENLLKARGRGLLLIRSLMDELEIRRQNPGMELTMIKRRRAN